MKYKPITIILNPFGGFGEIIGKLKLYSRYAIGNLDFIMNISKFQLNLFVVRTRSVMTYSLTPEKYIRE